MIRLLFSALSVCFGLKAGATTIQVGPALPVRSVSEAVQHAMPGDTVCVHGGIYAEGNIIIEKPMVLIGEDWPVLDGQFKCEIITVKSPYVTISGFVIRNSGQMSTIDLAGIKVLAVHHVVIEDNRIDKCNFGIYLSNTVSCTVRCNVMTGEPREEQNTGNGIHVWKGDSICVQGNDASGHRDGIYFEFVTNSVIEDNMSHNNIRYGLHFMFSHRDHYRFNIFRDNGAGVAVMFSHDVEMFRNNFLHNWGGAAYGLLLKEISDSDISGNRFEENTSGIYMEGANRIRVHHNFFRGNGWAMRIQASCDGNTVSDNDFMSNSFDVSTNGKKVLNSFNNNYWDKYEGYDLNHDGTGDVPYRPVSLYAVTVEQMPHGLLLMRSFMVYLMDRAERLIPSLTPVDLMDERPRMTPV